MVEELFNMLIFTGFCDFHPFVYEENSNANLVIPVS